MSGWGTRVDVVMIVDEVVVVLEVDLVAADDDDDDDLVDPNALGIDLVFLGGALSMRGGKELLLLVLLD